MKFNKVSKKWEELGEVEESSEKEDSLLEEEDWEEVDEEEEEGKEDEAELESEEEEKKSEEEEEKEWRTGKKKGKKKTFKPIATFGVYPGGQPDEHYRQNEKSILARAEEVAKENEKIARRRNKQYATGKH